MGPRCRSTAALVAAIGQPSWPVGMVGGLGGPSQKPIRDACIGPNKDFYKGLVEGAPKTGDIWHFPGSRLAWFCSNNLCEVIWQGIQEC